MQKIGTAFYRHMQLLATIGALLKIALVFARGVFALVRGGRTGVWAVCNEPTGSAVHLGLRRQLSDAACAGYRHRGRDRKLHHLVRQELQVRCTGASARHGADMRCVRCVAGVWGWSRIGSPDMEARHTRDEYHDDGRSYRRKCAAVSTWFVQRNQGPALVSCPDKVPQMRKRDAPLDSRRVPFCLCSVFY